MGAQNKLFTRMIWLIDTVYSAGHIKMAEIDRKWARSAYNDAGEETEVIELAPDSDCVALNIPIGQWHTVRVLESGTVILECKDGKYEPLGPEDILSNPA